MLGMFAVASFMDSGIRKFIQSAQIRLGQRPKDLLDDRQCASSKENAWGQIGPRSLEEGCMRRKVCIRAVHGQTRVAKVQLELPRPLEIPRGRNLSPRRGASCGQHVGLERWRSPRWRPRGKAVNESYVATGPVVGGGSKMLPLLTHVI